MKKKTDGVITVGLFGTCGNSQWRYPFVSKLETYNIEYFNPVVPDWKPENAEIEAEHLVEDEIILFPVTDETYGFGSLAEVGFSITQAIKSNSERFVLIYIAPLVSDELRQADESKARESDKARALALAHLKKQQRNFPNVYIVSNLDRMLEVMFDLIIAMDSMKKARALCIK